jgi:hypothetical protein
MVLPIPAMPSAALDDDSITGTSLFGDRIFHHPPATDRRVGPILGLFRQSAINFLIERLGVV